MWLETLFPPATASQNDSPTISVSLMITDTPVDLSRNSRALIAQWRTYLGPKAMISLIGSNGRLGPMLEFPPDPAAVKKMGPGGLIFMFPKRSRPDEPEYEIAIRYVCSDSQKARVRQEALDMVSRLRLVRSSIHETH